MTIKEKNIIYELLDGRSAKTATVIKCLSNEQTIIIPEEVIVPGSNAQNVKYTVDTISDSAFKDCENLKELSFKKPNNIKSIGANAFRNCISLETFTIPQNIDNISPGCFYNCLSLKKVESSAPIKAIGISAFEECIALKSIDDINTDNLISISENAFKNCYNLSVDLKMDLLTDIKPFAFDNCKKVIIIGDSLVYNNGEKFESINRNLKTKWALPNKLLLFLIPWVLFSFYSVACEYSYKIGSWKYKDFALFIFLIAALILSIVPIWFTSNKKKSYILKAVCCIIFILSLAPVFGIINFYVQPDQNIFNSIDINSLHDDNLYGIDVKTVSQDSTILVNNTDQKEYSVLQQNSKQDTETNHTQQVYIKDDGTTLIQIVNHFINSNIENIHFDFTGDSCSITISTNIDNVSLFLAQDDKSTKKIDLTDNKYICSFMDLSKLSILTVDNTDNNEEIIPLFDFYLYKTKSLSSNNKILTAVGIMFSLAFVALVLAIICLIKDFDKIRLFITNNNHIILSFMIIVLIVFSLVKKKGIVDIVLDLITARFGL